jgi:hypothetical protein
MQKVVETLKNLAPMGYIDLSKSCHSIAKKVQNEELNRKSELCVFDSVIEAVSTMEESNGHLKDQDKE